MNKIFLQLGIFALCGSILHSCTLSESVPEVEFPGDEVTFQTHVNASRSFIDGNLSTAGTTIQIYGYHGDKFLADNNDTKRLNGKSLILQSNNTWAVVNNQGSPITYFWEGYGTYRFFGWLTMDAASGKSVPFTPTYTDAGKLSINTVINENYNQFDFLYSKINHRKMTEANFNSEKKEAVSMDMNHLFTAFAIGIRNTSEDDIVVKRVSLNCIHERGSAEIDYSKQATANVTTEATSSIPATVTYGPTSKETANTPFITFSGDHTLTSRTGYAPNIFAPAATEKQFYMVWPQAGTVLNASSLTFDNEEAEAAEPDASFPLVLEYTVGDVSFKKRLRLPNENWQPGKKYYLEVQVADKLVEITATVKDWTFTDSKVDFKESSVTIKPTGKLAWDNTTCIVDDTKNEVYVKNGQPVEATFCIDAPKGAQWRVSLEGDVTAFSIIDFTAPTDDGMGPVDGEVHRIKIVPKIKVPDRDYKVKLKFVVITADHKTLSADNVFPDTNNDNVADIYTIVLR